MLWAHRKTLGRTVGALIRLIIKVIVYSSRYSIGSDLFTNNNNTNTKDIGLWELRSYLALTLSLFVL